MLNISNTPEEREQNATPTATNTDSIRDVGDKLNGAAIGKEGGTTLLFSKELATKINPKRPDITASLIIYGLYLWQKTKVKSFCYVPMVNGLRGSYRSLSDLRKEYPWLTDEGIRLALGRAEKALPGWFVVDRTNPKAERGKLHYWLSPKLIKKYRFAEERMGLLQVKRDDVLRYGIIEAILISNLEYITDDSRNNEPLVDDEGRIYRNLSPTTLTEEKEDLDGVLKSILPCKRNKLTEALTHLVAEDVMVEHLQKKGFYTLKMASERVSKVASGVSKVARQTEGMPSKPFVDQGLQSFLKTSDTNTYSNADSNSDSKYVFNATGKLRSPVAFCPLQMSDGAKKLMQLVNDELTAYRQKPARQSKLVYDEGQEDFYGPVFDKSMVNGGRHAHLPYDMFMVDWEGKPYTRKAEIKQAIKDIKSSLIAFPCRREDLEQLEQLFIVHPELEAKHILDLLAFLAPQTGNRGFGAVKRPSKGHDCYYWARRITDMKAFLRYLPKLAKEFFEYEAYWEGSVDDHYFYEEGKPVFEYETMPEPYLGIAFCGDTKTRLYTAHERIKDDEGFLEWITRPIYYAELAGIPTVDVVEHEVNPICEAA